MDGDVDLAAVAGQGLVHRVVDHLVDEVVQPGLAGGADVHGGPDADRLQPFEDADVPRAVLGRRLVRDLGVVAHVSLEMIGRAASGAPDLPRLDVKSRPSARQPLRPARVGGGHQRLATGGDLRADTTRAVLVQLGVEIVEKRHRREPALLAVDLERGQGQGEEQAARLARRGLEATPPVRRW